MNRVRIPKKTVSLFVALLLTLLTAAPVFGQTAGDRYLVTAARANILPEPSLTASALAEAPAGTYLYVTNRTADGDFLYVRLNAAGVEGWTHVSLLTYAGTDPAKTDGIKSIYVKTPPAKTVYTEDEESFDGAGTAVYAKYADGRPDAPLSGWRLFAPAFDTAGEKTVRAVYRVPGGASFSTSMTVTVNRVPLKALTVAAGPDRTAYVERQIPSLTGLRLRASYTDGRPDREFTLEEILADPDFTFSDCHGETAGQKIPVGGHRISVSYKYPEIACAFSLTAVPRTLTALTVATPPASATVYNKTDVPDLTGLTLAAAYDNGETETVTPDMCEVTCDPAAFVLGENNPVTVSYGGKSVTLSFRLAREIPVELRIVPPEILAFPLGEPIDLSELKVYILYNSGRREETQNYTLSEIDAARLGAQTVTVTCGAFSGAFTIYIQPYFRLGDVNGDGRVTAADARLVLRAAVGYVHYKGKLFTAADADKNKKIEAADARLILRAAVGLESLSQTAE